MKKYIALLITVLLMVMAGFSAGFSLDKEKNFSNDFSLTTAPSSTKSSTKQADKEKTDWVFSLMAGSYAVLSTVDLYTTLKGVDSGYKEGNPLWKGLVKNKLAAVCVKTLLAGVVTYAAYKLKKMNKPVGYVIFGAVVAFQIFVVIHNLRVLKRS